MILAGLVEVEGRRADKAGRRRPRRGRSRSPGPPHPYVSRGGVKLAAALDAFGIDPAGQRLPRRRRLDRGLHGLPAPARREPGLRRGRGARTARREAARRPARASCARRVNARRLSGRGRARAVDLAVVDVSFISLRLVLPACSPGEVRRRDRRPRQAAVRGGARRGSPRRRRAIRGDAAPRRRRDRGRRTGARPRGRSARSNLRSAARAATPSFCSDFV